MKLSNKNILIVSPEQWTHMFVSKHHYAIQLARRNNKVFFLNPPSRQNSVQLTDHENLRVINYKGFWKGIRYFPKFLRLINQYEVFREIERIAQVKFDIIWSFDNSVFFDFDALPTEVLKISHIVDLSQDFNTPRSSSTANICFGVIPKIVERHRAYNSNSYLIKHGVNIYENTETAIKLPGINHKKVLYFGNLAMPYLDWELFFKASMIFKEVDFVLLGSNHNNIPYSLPSNVHLLESVDSKELIYYMHAADILILFYESTYSDEYAFPHKLMEYLSSGKPIVSTFLSNCSDEFQLINMSSNHEEWIDLLRAQIDESVKEESFGLKEKRMAFAFNNTYEKQIQRIENIIDSL